MNLIFFISYDEFSLIVEIGSSLGLWTGLYIVTLFDLGVDSFNWIEAIITAIKTSNFSISSLFTSQEKITSQEYL